MESLLSVRRCRPVAPVRIGPLVGAFLCPQQTPGAIPNPVRQSLPADRRSLHARCYGVTLMKARNGAGRLFKLRFVGSLGLSLDGFEPRTTGIQHDLLQLLHRQLVQGAVVRV